MNTLLLRIINLVVLSLSQTINASTSGSMTTAWICLDWRRTRSVMRRSRPHHSPVTMRPLLRRYALSLTRSQARAPTNHFQCYPMHRNLSLYLRLCLNLRLSLCLSFCLRVSLVCLGVVLVYVLALL